MHATLHGSKRKTPPPSYLAWCTMRSSTICDFPALRHARSAAVSRPASAIRGAQVQHPELHNPACRRVWPNDAQGAPHDHLQGGEQQAASINGHKVADQQLSQRWCRLDGGQRGHCSHRYAKWHVCAGQECDHVACHPSRAGSHQADAACEIDRLMKPIESCDCIL